MPLVPEADVPQHGARQQREQGDGAEPGPSPMHDDDRGDERPERRAGVAADLKERLRESEPATGRHPRHARRLGMEDRRPDAEQAGADEQHLVALGEGENGQSGEREECAAGKGERRRTAIGVESDERLQERRRDLIGEGDETDLDERQPELRLEIRIDRREQRLHHVIEQMTEADRDEDGEDGVVARVGDYPMFAGI